MKSQFEKRVEAALDSLSAGCNFRRIPEESHSGLIDLTTNDYLGISTRSDLIEEFYSHATPDQLATTSVASRLLASRQRVYSDLEQLLRELYGKEALLYNSGYHANTGIIPAIASRGTTLILADKLVHASIIDGIKLSGAEFARFRHNDLSHLEQLIERDSDRHAEVLVVVESVYSMDGDMSDIEALIDIKRRHPKVILYVDEAHSFGVNGRHGLGIVASSSSPESVDIVIGTLGKAAASSGAFSLTNPNLRDFLINRSRSFIFSTAIAPVNAAWSRFVIERIVEMDEERKHLFEISRQMSDALGLKNVSHIIPFIVGDSSAAITLSRQLREEGVKVLPIRTPTVPPGTERLRISLSAALTDSEVKEAIAAFGRVDVVKKA